MQTCSPGLHKKTSDHQCCKELLRLGFLFRRLLQHAGALFKGSALRQPLLGCCWMLGSQGVCLGSFLYAYCLCLLDTYSSFLLLFKCTVFFKRTLVRLFRKYITCLQRQQVSFSIHKKKKKRSDGRFKHKFTSRSRPKKTCTVHHYKSICYRFHSGF